MRTGPWLLMTLGSVVVVAASVVALNVSLDIYGIFRDPHGRQLPVYGDERIAKYLLCDSYVPANFNALLVGSSVTANWKSGLIRTLRVYNTSVNGGNIVEEKAMVELATAKPG